MIAALPRRLFLSAMVILAIAAAPIPAVATPDLTGAQTFIEDLGDQTIAILTDPDASVAATEASFSQIFTDSFDTVTIGRFVLGRYWNAASAAEQQEYLDLFQQLVVSTYARRFSEYSGQTFEVVGARPERNDDVMVTTRIIQPDGPPVNVDWRVREREGQFRIIDVVVERVNMTITYRNEFTSIIQRGGGQVAALLDALRRQVSAP